MSKLKDAYNALMATKGKFILLYLRNGEAYQLDAKFLAKHRASYLSVLSNFPEGEEKWQKLVDEFYNNLPLIVDYLKTLSWEDIKDEVKFCGFFEQDNYNLVNLVSIKYSEFPMEITGNQFISVERKISQLKVQLERLENLNSSK